MVGAALEQGRGDPVSGCILLGSQRAPPPHARDEVLAALDHLVTGSAERDPVSHVRMEPVLGVRRDGALLERTGQGAEEGCDDGLDVFRHIIRITNPRAVW